MGEPIKDRLVSGDNPGRIKCKGCGRRNTFAENGVQYGRYRKAGLNHEEARDVLPRCQKCTTIILKATKGQVA